MHRLFIAIRPPEAICDLLVDAMDDSPELRWVGDELLHVTLRFVGEVERPLASDLAVALGRVEADPFELRISGIGRRRAARIVAFRDSAGPFRTAADLARVLGISLALAQSLWVAAGQQ